MNEYDGVLRMYADSGLRTIQDWALLGRDIASGEKPRLDTPHRGGVLSLYPWPDPSPTPVTARSALTASGRSRIAMAREPAMAPGGYCQK